MGKLLEIFGKESGLKHSDIQAKIVEPGLEESLTVEYKAPGDKESDEASDLVEKLLLKPLVSFLNKTEHQSSLLVLGVVSKKGVPSKVDPIPEPVLSMEQVNTHIRDNIGALPSTASSPAYIVIEVRCGDDGKIFLVELNRWDTAGYFSRRSNCAYVREGDRSRKLSIPEFHALVGRFRTSAASLSVDNIKTERVADAPGITYVIAPRCANGGSRPATFVNGFIEFKFRENGKGSVTEIPSDCLDVSHVNPGRTIYTFSVNKDTNWPVYPGGNILLNPFKIHFAKPTTFEISTVTNDNDGKSTCRFRVTATGRLKDVEHGRTLWG